LRQAQPAIPASETAARGRTGVRSSARVVRSVRISPRKGILGSHVPQLGTSSAGRKPLPRHCLFQAVAHRREKCGLGGWGKHCSFGGLWRVKENLGVRGTFSSFSIASHYRKSVMSVGSSSSKLLHGNGMNDVRVFWRNLSKTSVVGGQWVEGRGSRWQNED
jgi:hypothetical protein